MKISAKRLGKILLFYSVFYTILGVFAAAMFTIFLKTLDDRAPKWQLDKSLIGSNPGLSIKPPFPDNIIAYKSNDPKQISGLRQQLDEFLAPYFEKHDNVQDCDNKKFPDEGKVCDFTIKDFSPCVPETNYSYGRADAGPCVFLKINKIFGWVPETYNETDLPQFIENFSFQRNKIWVTCEPQNRNDAENIGPRFYYPDSAFESKYFPFTNTRGYLSPLVAVFFENPKRGVLIKVECKLWAKNIHHDAKNSKGVVRFALLID
ncbi:sodium/potassium-transporting ATPase subunit beta-2 [Tribolium castaneum]|uniref:Sodium/potassium-transporting ATPase subunit beta-2-like Protein n=1 Tax=Tribolium castaneum TaxID=7070 RepID=D6WJJ0_TRICA|nr:PREDICTED: sodium/potassium-transporting ATPase subunit beta-2 [Tribolium castaneum]EFA03903.2 Sodium/potassium-transporting ATPase subunit beta-2-like Protein [Tribolium castaneum]|eukprot:XP_008193076.1 PREDICTED: sodium/potassium-transporting ATPase subunit beta-2 [Tribolium castaneum]